MKKYLGDFFTLFVVQSFNYGVLCWNYRAISKASYLHVAMSDILAAILTFYIIRKVVKSDSKSAFLGYVLGGVCGSLVSIWITVKFGL